MRDDHLLPLPELDTWRNDAACRGHDTALWFDPTRPAEVLAICDTCPVDDPCRIAGRREEGIWGGVEIRSSVTTVQTFRSDECGQPFTRKVAAGTRPVTCGYRCRQDRNLRLAREAKERRRAS